MAISRDNPWTTHRTDVAFETPWLRIHANQVTHKVAGDSIYGTVHFKSRALGILPLGEDGTTWLVGQYRYPLKRWSWEMPEGGGALDGDALEGAKRELEEEAGLRAARWDHWFDIDLSNSVTDETGVIFLARDLTPVDEAIRRKADATELLELRQVPLREACRMVRRGEIRDVMTVAALFAAEAAGLLEDPRLPLKPFV